MRVTADAIARRGRSPPQARLEGTESWKIVAFPEPRASRAWRSALWQEVAGASESRPAKALGWFLEVMRSSLTKLGSSGDAPSLDTMLAAALDQTARGDLATEGPPTDEGLSNTSRGIGFAADR